MVINGWRSPLIDFIDMMSDIIISIKTKYVNEWVRENVWKFSIQKRYVIFQV